MLITLDDKVMCTQQLCVSFAKGLSTMLCMRVHAAAGVWLHAEPGSLL